MHSHSTCWKFFCSVILIVSVLLSYVMMNGSAWAATSHSKQSSHSKHSSHSAHLASSAHLGSSTHLTSSALSALSARSQKRALSPSIDQVSQQVLLNMHLNGWNPKAQYRGVTTGGLFVNWNMLNPQQTNLLGSGSQNPSSCNVLPLPPGCPDPQTVQDPQTALYYLNDLAEYKALHPQDHSYDADLSRTTSLVMHEYASYNLPKGWIYFYLLRAGQLLQNYILISEARQAAYNYYTHWYNPQLGFVYNHSHGSIAGTYTTEHSITAGAALINAGTLWNQPTWVLAGQSTLDHILASAYNLYYNFFYHDMTVASDGSQQVANPQAKPDAQGSIVEALTDAYTHTSNPRYLSVAQQLLQSLLVSSGLWDQANGGLFFALDMSTGSIKQNYKETRSQAHVLIALTRYNAALQRLGQAPQFLNKVQQLTSLLTNKFYQSTYHGYLYRLTPTFGLYVTSSGITETYFTTEAMGISLDALQQTEFPSLLF